MQSRHVDARLTPPDAMACATGRVPIIAMLRLGSSITLIALLIVLLGYKFMLPLIFGGAA